MKTTHNILKEISGLIKTHYRQSFFYKKPIFFHPDYVEKLLGIDDPRKTCYLEPGNIVRLLEITSKKAKDELPTPNQISDYLIEHGDEAYGQLRRSSRNIFITDGPQAAAYYDFILSMPSKEKSLIYDEAIRRKQIKDKKLSPFVKARLFRASEVLEKEVFKQTIIMVDITHTFTTAVIDFIKSLIAVRRDAMLINVFSKKPIKKMLKDNLVKLNIIVSSESSAASQSLKLYSGHYQIDFHLYESTINPERHQLGFSLGPLVSDECSGVAIIKASNIRRKIRKKSNYIIEHHKELKKALTQFETIYYCVSRFINTKNNGKIDLKNKANYERFSKHELASLQKNHPALKSVIFKFVILEAGLSETLVTTIATKASNTAPVCIFNPKDLRLTTLPKSCCSIAINPHDSTESFLIQKKISEARWHTRHAKHSAPKPDASLNL